MARSLSETLRIAAGRPSSFNAALNSIAKGFINGGVFNASTSGSSSTGQNVTVNSAMRLAAFWACVRLVAETVATLPIGLYRRLPDGGRESLTSNPLYDVLALSPNYQMTSVQFWEAMMASMLLWGNAYAHIYRSGNNVIALGLLLPTKMALEYSKDESRLRYFYSFPSGKKELMPEDILHIPAFSLDGLVGLTPISYGADVIGAAQAADVAANTTFKNGMMPTVAFKLDRVLKKDQRTAFREYVETISGAMNAGKSPVLEQGISTERIGINPVDAQLLESRAWSLEEICRLFRVPPWMIGYTEKSTSWGTGLEQQVLGFITFSIAPWLKRIERAITKSLIRPEDRQSIYAEYNLEALLRGDSAARAAFYSTMSQNGIYTRDDCRVRENLPRRGGNADVLTVQTNLSPIDMLGKTSDGQAARDALQSWLGDSTKE